MAAQMRSVFVVIEGREIHYVEWLPQGVDPTDAAAVGKLKVLIMWHGLLRTGRDYDEVAAVFASKHEYRVICPDTIGRGLSQWSPNPDDEYTIPFYMKLLAGLLTALQVEGQVDYVGTSMGGIIGYCTFGTILKGRARRLVLVDVGPVLNPVAIDRIKQYATATVSFDRVSEMETLFRAVYKPFGPVSDRWMRRITEVGFRRLPGGKVTTHYDPEVTAMLLKPLNAAAAAMDPWFAYDQLDCPVLVVRGADSDLLLPDDAMAMLNRPTVRDVQLVTVPGCGHAPSLEPESQHRLLEAFFSGLPVEGAVRGGTSSSS